MGRKLIDFTGQRFGMLTIISYAGNSKWNCICDCGNNTVVSTCHIKSGHTRSCGCLHEKTIHSGNNTRTHGMSRTRLHRIWSNMRSRCNNRNVPCYQYYGGRGISVCGEWGTPDGFEAFYKWAVNNGYSSNLTLDRIDVNGDYDPDNCRWISMLEQMNNTRTNHLITYNGEEKTLAEWARCVGLPYQRVINRINSLGWSVEKALTTPINTKMGRKRNASRIQNDN